MLKTLFVDNIWVQQEECYYDVNIRARWGGTIPQPQINHGQPFTDVYHPSPANTVLGTHQTICINGH